MDSDSRIGRLTAAGSEVRAVVAGKSEEDLSQERRWDGEPLKEHNIVLCPNHACPADLDIDQLRRRILEACEAKLRRLEGKILMNDALRQECRRQVVGIVEDFLQSLAQGTPTIDEQSVAGAAELGMNLLVNAISPAEFARSAADIFDLACEAVLEALGRGTVGNADTEGADIRNVMQRSLTAFRALNRSAAERFQLAAERYEGVLLHQATKIQASDRLRLARRIHDEVGNDLSLAIRYLDLHDAYQATDPGRASEKIFAARSTLRRIAEAVRVPASELRLEPRVVNIGLALRTFLWNFEASDVVLGLQVDADEAQIPENIRNELFIIVREALKNAITHARAHQVRATVSIVAGSVEAQIEDDGVGILADSEYPPSLRGGMRSMRERAELLGGLFSVSAGLSSGTRITIRIPLPATSCP